MTCYLFRTETGTRAKIGWSTDVDLLSAIVGRNPMTRAALLPLIGCTLAAWAILGAVCFLLWII